MSNVLETAVKMAAENRVKYLETYISMFLEKTGMRITDLVLCESISANGQRFWVEPKTVNEKREWEFGCEPDEPEMIPPGRPSRLHEDTAGPD